MMITVTNPGDAPGQKLFSGNCEFVSGAVSEESLPPMKLPEIAFAGRSNVGKSSLINAVTNRRNLARTSAQPGRTQEINFFTVGDRLTLVDLPGYGFAEAPKGKVDEWNEFTRRYLCGRASLRRVMVLLDARRMVTPHDEEFMKMLDSAAVAYQLVLTKCDKMQQELLQKAVLELGVALKKHPAAMKDVLFTSAHKGQGIEQIRNVLAGVVQT